MSVYVVDFNPAENPSDWLVVHDDAPGGLHSDLIDPNTVVRVLNMDGSESHQFARVDCSICGSSSTHPVGGGAQPPLVQELFVHLALREGCPCPAPFAASRTGPPPDDADVIAAHDHVKAHCEEMDGEGRWQVTPEQLRESLSA